MVGLQENKMKKILALAFLILLGNCTRLPAIQYHSKFSGEKLDSKRESQLNEIRKKICDAYSKGQDILSVPEVLHPKADATMFFYEDSQMKMVKLENPQAMKKMISDLGKEDIYDTFLNVTILDVEDIGVGLIQNNPSKEYRDKTSSFTIKNPPLKVNMGNGDGPLRITSLYKMYGYKHVPYPKALDSDP